MESYLKLAGYLLAAILLGCAAILPFHFEAEAYNKLSHPLVKATTWDAIFVKLRVINCSNISKDKINQKKLK